MAVLSMSKQEFGITDIVAGYPELASRWGICIPTGIARRQIRDIGLEYTHPAERHYSASVRLSSP
jgi:hypothetical protein